VVGFLIDSNYVFFSFLKMTRRMLAGHKKNNYSGAWINPIYSYYFLEIEQPSMEQKKNVYKSLRSHLMTERWWRVSRCEDRMQETLARGMFSWEALLVDQGSSWGRPLGQKGLESSNIFPQ